MTRLDRIAFGLVIIAWVAGLATLALAQPMPSPTCAEREVVVQRLAERYGETLHGMGISGNIGIVELYASDETGTWTILLSKPDGSTCPLASGEMWEQMAAPVLGDPS